MAVEPTNPIETIIRLMIGLLMLFFGVSASQEPPVMGGGGGGPAPARVLTVIEKVDALVLESMPPQVSLVMTGYQPDGCDFPVLVEQRRSGNSVTVEVYREVPADIMCTMQLVPYSGSVMLDGAFEPGVYQISVNGVLVELRV